MVDVPCRDVTWFKNVPNGVRQLYQGNVRRTTDQSYTLAGDYNSTDKTGSDRRNCGLHIKDITMLHAGQYHCTRYKEREEDLPLNFYVSVVGK
jgi:hypothetical protein